jgi:DNA-binding response OmpR family regulator
LLTPGWEAARRIRALIPGKRPLLIGISGQYTKGADKILAEMSGFDYYLMKPADPKVLLTLVANAQSRTTD